MATWFITGASRGFGLEIARQALERGDRVVATARNPKSVEDALPGYTEQLLALELDVTNESQAKAAVDAAVERFGTIDVVVNNAGRGLLGAVEEASDAAVRAVYDTNVFGVLNVTRAALPVLRAQRSGHIINMSSVGGFAGYAGWGIYCSTKFAVEGFSEALQLELAPLGVNVTIVEPGYFRTDFLDVTSLATEQQVIEDYAQTSGAMRDLVPGINHTQPGDPIKGAAAILQIADAPKPPVRVQLGSDCVSELDRKVAQLQEESASWREFSLSTDHDDVTAR
ncbi:short-chain dehydrogenase/reductase [Streptomyces sp. WAC 01325]|uniref:oxidoreductase n=1 Tax=Streptomyces sp. WAC 01325 TaxID=2203202 RepID=UPI000F877608|nr:oxidoreductase [Streptomyces sp. WAC 01325]RSM87203.1 short-chain dehydrogenase/reductase [Streptomyces sp. WAC 01325]